MADNGFKDGIQFPFPDVEDGKGYDKEIKKRANAILSTLMGFRPSNYLSEIPSTEYSKHMRAMATELAKLTFELERLSDDQKFENVRSEFLYQIVGELVFINDKIPEIDFDDEEFRNFLLKVIDIYFQGSTPESIRDAVELFTDEDFTVTERFKDARNSPSARGIGDQFEFNIEFESGKTFADDYFGLQNNLNLLIQLVKPAHTLFAARSLFEELFPTPERVETSERYFLKDDHYEDVRSYWQGMAGFTSNTGMIEQSNKSQLKETDDSKPLGKSAIGTELIVLKGDNSGIYRVTDHSEDDNTIKVTPPFDETETDVSYSIKTDRKGANEEVKVEGEDASHQFQPQDPLNVNANGPYTVRKGDDVQINATSNYDKVQFKWDLTGDGTFDDASGSPVTVDTSRYSGNKVRVAVKAESTLYGDDYEDLEGDDKVFYRPSAEDIEKFVIYLV